MLIGDIFFNFLMIILPFLALYYFLELKLVAKLEARVGINYAGPRGILQGVADTLKQLLKKPPKDRSLFINAWFLMMVASLFSVISYLPLNSNSLFLDSEMSLFLPVFTCLVFSFSELQFSVSSGKVEEKLNSVQYVSQSICALLPVVISILYIGIVSGGFSWSTVIQSQSWDPFSWNIFSTPPFALFAFPAFYLSGYALLGSPPFQVGLTHTGIKSGVETRLEGRWNWLLRLSHVFARFFWTSFTVIVFFGAWSIPISWVEYLQEGGFVGFLAFLEGFVLFAKVIALMLVTVLISRASPKVHVELTTRLLLKVFTPLSLIALAGAIIMKGVIGIG